MTYPTSLYGPYPKVIKFTPDEFWVSSEYTWIKPTKCDDPTHIDSDTKQINCFKAKKDSSMGFSGQSGWFGLNTLINVAGLPGTKKTLTSLSAAGMIRYGGAVAVASGANMSVKTQQNGTQFGQKDVTRNLDYFQAPDVLTMSQDLTGLSTLYVELWLSNKTNIITPGSWSEVHVKDLKLTVMYETDVAPQPAKVTISVVDWSKFTPIPNATVTILNGDVPMASGKTDADGYVTFENVPAPPNVEYGLRIFARDYMSYSGSIKVSAPATQKEYTLVYQPGQEIDWMKWLTEYWYVPVGVGAGVLVLLLLWPKSPITIISPSRER